jgi:predicted ATPase
MIQSEDQSTRNGRVLEPPTIKKKLTGTKAQDLLNFFILAPTHLAHSELQVRVYVGEEGQDVFQYDLQQGENSLTIPFVPGPVRFEVVQNGGSEVVLGGEGRRIEETAERYNFNFWSGSWAIELD